LQLFRLSKGANSINPFKLELGNSKERTHYDLSIFSFPKALFFRRVNPKLKGRISRIDI